MQRVALGTTTAGRLLESDQTPQRLPLLQQVQEALFGRLVEKTASGREALEALDIKAIRGECVLAAASIVYIITGRRSARRAYSIRGNEYCVPPTQAFQRGPLACKSHQCVRDRRSPA